MRLFLTCGHANKRCIEHFADKELQYFIDNPNELQETAYRLKRGVASHLYRQWKKKNKYLNIMHDFLMEMLAHRRQTVLFKHNPNLITHTQYNYDEEWRKGEERKDGRKLNILKQQPDAPTYAFFPNWEKIKTLEDAKEFIKEKEKNKIDLEE